MRVRETLLVAASILLGVWACGTPDGGIQLDHPINFDGQDGTRALKLVPGKEQVKLQDGNGELLARFELVDGRLQVNRAPPELTGFVVPAAGGGFHMLEPNESRVLYRLSREPDGDLRLETGSGNLLYKMKRRDYGFKTVDADGRVESRVRVRESKISRRDATGATTLSTSDVIAPAAFACFTLRELPIEHQAALALGIIHWGPDSL